MNTGVLESQQAPVAQFVALKCCVASTVPWSLAVSGPWQQSSQGYAAENAGICLSNIRGT